MRRPSLAQRDQHGGDPTAERVLRDDEPARVGGVVRRDAREYRREAVHSGRAAAVVRTGVLLRQQHCQVSLVTRRARFALSGGRTRGLQGLDGGTQGHFTHHGALLPRWWQIARHRQRGAREPIYDGRRGSRQRRRRFLTYLIKRTYPSAHTPELTSKLHLISLVLCVRRVGKRSDDEFGDEARSDRSGAEAVANVCKLRAAGSQVVHVREQAAVAHAHPSERTVVAAPFLLRRHVKNCQIARAEAAPCVLLKWV